jgi:hypothetical protein
VKVEDVWQVHRQWAVVARGQGRSLRRWRIVNLGLILSGSILAALAANDSWMSRGAAVVVGATSAAVLAAAGIVQSRLLTADRTADRVAARAAAEAYKGIVYRYLAAGPADPDRARELSDGVAQVDRLTADRSVLVVGVRPDGHPLPDVGGIADYADDRADGQREWHAQGAVRHRRLAHRWRAAELAATLVAAVLAAVGGALRGPSLSAWVAVATTAAAAFAAYLASQQHDRLAQAYARTSLSLQSLLRDFDPAAATPDEAERFVASTETVLADQNEAWTSLYDR